MAAAPESLEHQQHVSHVSARRVDDGRDPSVCPQSVLPLLASQKRKLHLFTQNHTFFFPSFLLSLASKMTADAVAHNQTGIGKRRPKA